MLEDLFAIHVSVLELVLRGTLVYWLLFLIFRFILRRDVGAVGIADILLLVIVADAAQNAMSGGYDTFAEGAILVLTIVGWNWLLDVLSWRFALVRRFADRVCVMTKGRIVEQGAVADVFERPAHEYTRHLLDSEPRGEPPAADPSRTA